MRRTLSLRRETLSELSTEELAVVAGGSHLCFLTHLSVDTPCATLHDPCTTIHLACL